MNEAERGNRPGPGKRVLLVGPRTPPYGGMALQAELMERLMNGEGVPAVLVASNAPFPRWCRSLERLPGVRTVVRLAVFSRRVWRMLAAADAVHILACSWFYFFGVVYPAVIMARVRRKRIVLNYRGGEAWAFFQSYDWLAKPAFRLATVVTAPSAFLADVIGGFFGVPVRIVPNILDFSRFRYRERPTLRPKLLVTRHLEKIYDIESILKAFQVVRERCPEASLWIAGGGSEESRLRQLAAEWKLEGVRFLGQIPHDKLPGILDQCDIFVNASRVDNFPGALLEASAAGLAVVSTAPGGIPYIYRNLETALLVEPGDWRGLAAAVLKVLNHPSLGMQMTRAAIDLIRTCEWTQVRKSLYAAYGFRVDEYEANPLLPVPGN